MVPLFPTITTEDRLHNHPRPISIQKLVPNQVSATQHQFKHLPAERLQSAVQRAAADLQLEQTTQTLLQALNLQSDAVSPSAGRRERRRRRRPGPLHTDLDKTAHSDSEVSSISHRQNNETCDPAEHVPTTTTLLSEQATQTGASAAGGRAGGGQLPSLHLLCTLQARLVAALRQVGQLRAQGPWQGRVLDQHDWDRKLAKMDEFHAKITREMYILTRQVDLIMDSVCSIPRTRVTSSLKGDVTRKLVRAHRSALRVTQAFVQNYWDGSLDGRPVGRFLQLLSVCRSLTDVCQHLNIDTASDIADLPERLATMVQQHATTAGDVGSLIREMALGRFGPAVTAVSERRRPARQPARPGLGGPRDRQHHKVKSAVDRLRACRTGERLSVRSAPAVRRLTGHQRAARPGSAPHAPPKARHQGSHAPLPPLPEERDSCSSDEEVHDLPDHWTNYRDRDRPQRPHRGPGPVPSAVWSGRDQLDHAGHTQLAATVEEAVRRVLSGTAAAEPSLPPAPTAARVPARESAAGGRPVSQGGRDRLQQRQQEGWERHAADRLRPATEMADRAGTADNGDYRDSRERQHNGEDGDGRDISETSGRRAETSGRQADLQGGEEPPASRMKRKEGGDRDGTDRRKNNAGRRRRKKTHGATHGGGDRVRHQLRHVLSRLEELQRERDVIRRRWAPLILARRTNEGDTTYLELGADLRDGVSPGTAEGPAVQRTGKGDTQPAVPSRPGGLLPPPRADAATSTSQLTAPPPPPPPLPPLGRGPSGDQHRSVRDVFAAEALDPQLRADLRQQLRGLLTTSDDSAIKSLPEETVHELVDEFISEAGVDIFLHQLFDQEFEIR